MNKMAASEVVFELTRTELGWAIVAATGRGVCALHLGDDRDRLRQLLLRDFPEALPASPKHRSRPLLAAALSCIAMTLAPSRGRSTTVPQQPRSKTASSQALRLDLRGTPFQLAVWRLLQRIPAGSTISYRELADRLGSPRAARAVAAACAANRLAVVVPCHRVVRGDGGLAGYRWGVERKRDLLAAESASAASS